MTYGSYLQSQRRPNSPKPKRSTCSGCGAAVKTAGKGWPTYDLTKPLTEHLCRPRSIDMTTGEIDTFLGATDIPRDRWGRPLILAPDGKRKGYTRCTTFVGCLEDTYNLAKWQQRMVALGLASRDDLLLSVSAHSDDKNELDKICEAAKEAAAASSGATKGTALHRICERLDRGEKVEIPTAAKADVAAYQERTKGVRWTHIERLMVHDGLEVAGTPDRLGIAPAEDTIKVWDLKTGSIDFGMGKIAMQLALYAHSRAYDPDTGERNDIDIDLQRAVVIHLPAGSGVCNLVEVDIQAGWEAVEIARLVRDWRKRKNLSRPYALEPVSTGSLAHLIEQAPTVEALRGLWSEHRAAWTDELNALANQRKAALSLAAAS